MGATYDFTYPENFILNFDTLNKIYLAHAMKTENFDTEELLELNLQDKIILSYCNKNQVKEVGYEILVLFLYENEKLQLETFKKDFLCFARDTIAKPKNERTDFILKNLKIFFKEVSHKKILVLGRAGTGKSSIKKVLFEGIDPKELISKPLEPTRGITPTVYSWLDLKIGLFDTSGQEIEDLLEEGNEQLYAFSNADAVIYLLDFPIWIVHKDLILEDIKKIKKILIKYNSNIKLFLFLHKIDLINITSRTDTISKIQSLIKERFNLPVFFTSLFPELIYSTYNAFYEILASLSELTSKLKAILDEELGESSKTLLFITNNNHNIIAQTMSNDFEINFINYIHKMSAQLTITFEDMSNNNNIDTLILTSSKDLTIIMRNLNLAAHDINNIICASEKIKMTDLTIMTHKIKLKCMSLVYDLDL